MLSKNFRERVGFAIVVVPLTPAQWLPKPATSQLPHKRRSLREMWSPRRGGNDVRAGMTKSPLVSEAHYHVRYYCEK